MSVEICPRCEGVGWYWVTTWRMDGSGQSQWKRPCELCNPEAVEKVRRAEEETKKWYDLAKTKRDTENKEE